MSKADLRDDLRKKYGSRSVEPESAATPPPGAPADQPPAEVQPERAFVVQGDHSTVITAPLREIAAVNQGFTYLRGRFVEADAPNNNGALWTAGDLEIGAPTVAGGPLNWLHQDTKIIGAVLDGRLVDREAAAKDGLNTHIVSDAVVWNFLYPNETRIVEKAAEESQLFYSMECLSRMVECIDSPGRPGCGEQFTYADYNFKRACAHLNARSSVRRFVDPYFLGGAVIVPPVKPGWSHANADVVRQAAALQEEQSIGSGFMETEAARELAACIVSWANRDA